MTPEQKGLTPSEAVALIQKGARHRSKSIPDGILPLLLNFGAATPGIRHPLFRMIGADGRRHLDGGGMLLLLGSPGSGKTVTGCCLGLLTAKKKTIKAYSRLTSAFVYGGKEVDPDTGEERDYWVTDTTSNPNFSYWSSMDYLDKMFGSRKDAPDPTQVPHMFILDDFGHEHTPTGGWMDKRINNLLLYRHTHRLPMIIISNKLVQEIRNDYADHIVSRLFDKDRTRLIEYFTDTDLRSES